jgi:hypothetical protein
MKRATIVVVFVLTTALGWTQQRATEEYEVGAIGPAGGRIFYDKGHVTDGWRYLEAAPAEAEFTADWGAYLKEVGGTTTGIGTGKRNTELIVEFLRRNGENGKAAQLCDSLNIDGYDDWFLPSRDELNLMYTRPRDWENLALPGTGLRRSTQLISYMTHGFKGSTTGVKAPTSKTP